MNDDDLFKILISSIFALVIGFGGRYYSQRLKSADDEAARIISRMDEQDKRLRDLERDSVTHDDLRRLESKLDQHNRQVNDRMDEHYKQVTDRLDRILEGRSK